SGQEGRTLTLPIQAVDPEGKPLTYWAEHLPQGAVFDPIAHTLIWTPDFHSAGTYPDVRFRVSDGRNPVSRTVTIVVAPDSRPPTLLKPADRTVREGDLVQIALQASDPEGASLTYFSDGLPVGAVLDPRTGVFTWTPDFTQHGVYRVPFTVSNGRA